LSDLDGSWNITIKSPTGEQKAKLTVRSVGETFAGDFVGDEGTIEITDGKVEGETISWSMKIVKPLPMTLTSKLTLEGDALNGAVTAGAFGSFPMAGTRA
jgi:hypothetical protein